VLQEMMDLYQAGIQVTEFTLKDVNVPTQVRDAFSDVNKAREDRQRFIEEARGHANSVIPGARGAAARVIEEAQGYKEATVAVAEGEAQRFTLVLNEYLRAPDVTRKRLYLEAMEKVLGESSKVLIDTRSSGNVLYLPLDQMGAAGTKRNSMPPLVTPDVGQNSGGSDNSPRSSSREGRQ
jgi:membrane protease subunit HflK